MLENQLTEYRHRASETRASEIVSRKIKRELYLPECATFSMFITLVFCGATKCISCANRLLYYDANIGFLFFFSVCMCVCVCVDSTNHSSRSDRLHPFRWHST